MSPLRQRMLEDMKLAGLMPRTQVSYVKSVYYLASYYRRSPDELSEEDVRACLLNLKAQGVARGTFKTSHYGIRFLYCQTLGKEWSLFGKKRSGNPNRNVCQLPSPIRKYAIS
ncbi:MAG: phage integrase N-terminal SAM-like domain-containing protein [Magnetococcales bacterium]|nr:phage integrase N-terminal SAM-like domain-containing protein [Magnetococcales bacterium]